MAKYSDGLGKTIGIFNYKIAKLNSELAELRVEVEKLKDKIPGT